MFTEITYLGTGNTNDSTLYHIEWLPPRNVRALDLDHYELIVGNYTMNIDAKENAVIISLTVTKEPLKLVTNIVAVDRCGRKSIGSSEVINTTSLFNMLGDLGDSCSCNKEIAITSSIIALLLVTLMMVVICWLVTHWHTTAAKFLQSSDDSSCRGKN